MQNCLIDRDCNFDCSALTQGGIGNYVILVNKDDWDAGTVTIDTGVTEEITSIVLDTGKEGYAFEGSKESNIIPSTAQREVDGMDGFDHQIDIKVFDVSQLSRENIAKMRFNKVVAVIPLNNGKALCMGKDVGMRMSGYVHIPGDASLSNLIQFILKTPADGAPEIATEHVIASTFDITTLLTAAP